MEMSVNYWEYNVLKELLNQRLKAEDKRLNECPKIVEDTIQQINSINITLQKQSDNISEISTNISRMVKKQEEEFDCIKILKNKDGEHWKSTLKSMAQIAGGLIGGLLLTWAKNLLGL